MFAHPCGNLFTLHLECAHEVAPISFHSPSSWITWKRLFNSSHNHDRIIKLKLTQWSTRVTRADWNSSFVSTNNWFVNCSNTIPSILTRFNLDDDYRWHTWTCSYLRHNWYQYKVSIEKLVELDDQKDQAGINQILKLSLMYLLLVFW